ncbi:MAG: hypothetical protein KDA79_07465 [Planctomycetaceae bacterium]|nr:hypothetical protein [Planctomycetaceae bacterium]
MKRLGTAALVLLALGALISRSDALQRRPDNDRPRQGDGSPPPPPHRGPLLDLFDTNDDGELSSREIQAAAAVLSELDQNGDGRLTRDELPRPPRPEDHGPDARDRRDRRPEDQQRGNRRPRNRGPEDRPRDESRRGDGPRDEPGQRGPQGERPDRPLPRDDERAVAAQPGDVVFRGGYETDRRDGGRPVALIAAALGVEPQVFRDAFSRVTPARGGDGPSPALARRNKEVLLDALGKHGIANDRLDEVSNFYRYRPEGGELWRHASARATAIIENGQVTGFRITSAGYGYLTPPRVTVAGHDEIKVEATLGFSTDMRQNGRVTSLQIAAD